MDELTLDAMKQRLDRLEQENRRLKQIGGLMLVGIAALVMMGQSQSNVNKTAASQASKVVEATEFVVRDPGGKVRARLATDGLSFNNDADKPLVHLSLYPCPALSLDGLNSPFDKGGTPKPSVSLVADCPGVPPSSLGAGLHLYGMDERIIHLSTGILPSGIGGPYLRMSRKDNKASILTR